MKVSALLGAEWDHASIEVLWEDAERVFCRLGGEDAESDRHAFIPVLAGADHPTLRSINRLAHEYELKEYLDAAWALRAVGAGARARANDAGCRVSRRRAPGSPYWPAHGDRTISTARSGPVRRTWPAARTWTHPQGHQAVQRDRRFRDWRKSGSPASALPLAFRASANRRNLPSSSQERSPTWRQNKPDE